MPKTVAIIDDELEMEDIYRLILEGPLRTQMLELKFFSDPKVFLQWFNWQKPDLILTDINMPELSGIELSKNIRQSGCVTPIYLVSGYEQKAYSQSMKELHINRFIEKPLDFQQVLQFISADLQFDLSNI